MPYREWRISRLELYQHLWNKPLMELAEMFDVHRSEILVLCRKFNIPKPPMGYWVKKFHGKPLEQTPLPALEGQEEITVKLYVGEVMPVDPVQKNAADEIKQAIERPENRIKVPAELVHPHPLVAASEKSLQVLKPNQKSLLISESPGALNIQVSEKRLDRSLRIMDALIKALERYGMEVRVENGPKGKTLVDVLGEEFVISMEEIVKRKERELTAKQKAEKGYWHGREYTYHPTGRLVLRISTGYAGRSHASWTDGTIRRVDLRLNSVVRTMVNMAVSQRSERLHREQRERAEKEAQRRREDLAMRQQVEQARLNALRSRAAAWEESRRIRAFILALRTQAEEGGLSEVDGLPVSKWAEWAEQCADRIDPLKVSPPSVLDERIK